jgi:hypothetical protein
MGLLDWLFKKKPEGDACIACDSTELDVLAPGVYRCLSCRYEGGENRQDFERLEKLEALRSLPDDERHDRAVALVENARLGLIAARGDVRAAHDAIPSVLRQRDQEQQEELARSLSLTALTSTLEVVSQLESALALTGSLETLASIHVRFQGGDWRRDITVAAGTLDQLQVLVSELEAKLQE